MNDELPGASLFDYHQHVYAYEAEYDHNHGGKGDYHNGVPHQHNIANLAGVLHYGPPILVKIASSR